jgi:hypothetical protein
MGDPEDPSYLGSPPLLNPVAMNYAVLSSQPNTVPGGIDREDNGGPTVGLNLNDGILPRKRGAE